MKQNEKYTNAYRTHIIVSAGVPYREAVHTSNWFPILRL